MSASYKKITLNKTLERKARMLELSGDPTRIRILCFMFKYKKACVSDIAKSVGMSVACVSHHLQLMRDNGYFTTERMGNNVCYTLCENRFTNNLERLVCA